MPTATSSGCLDPANPARVDGAFGAKSVLELPGYDATGSLRPPGPAGKRRELTIAPRSVQGEIPVTLWSPDGLGDRTPAPLLVVHDGPEYDELAGLAGVPLVPGRHRGPASGARRAARPRSPRRAVLGGRGVHPRAVPGGPPRLRTEVETTAAVGVGASLGALAMLYAQRQNAGCLDALFLQSGSFFHPRHDAHERRLDLGSLPLFDVAKSRRLVDSGEMRMPRRTTKGPRGDNVQAPNRLDLALGQRICQRRKAFGMSQTALADAIGLTFQQIQKYERGFNRVSFSRLVDIAHALDCRVVELIGDLDDASIPSPLFRQDTAHLRETGAPDLLAAYSAMPARLQKAVVKLVVELAKARRVTPAA